jgi:hypothetical protein
VNLGAEWTPRPLFFDLGALLHAPKVDLARGTFGHAVVSLSSRRKKVYTFQLCCWEGLGPRVECIVSSDYYQIARLSSDWRKIMKTAYCVSWRWQLR